MKRALVILFMIALCGIIAFLGVTKHLAQQRADRLDRAWKEAEARAMDLESDLQAVKDQLADLAKTQPAPSAPVTSPAPGGATQGTATAPPATTGPSTLAGALVRYAATAAPGLTNLVRIEGTSTVHDWQVEGRMIGGSAEFPPGFPPPPGTEPSTGPIDAKATAFIPVRSLKSYEKDGRPYSDAMDEIMYGKLLAETNKRIIFTLISLAHKPQAGNTNAVYQYEAIGNLAVAGVTNSVTMPVMITSGPGGKVQVTGWVKAKMTDFKITPPSPSLPGGISIKTGDDVTLRFNWWLNPVRVEAAK
jgi:hypothetical protein